MTDYSVVHCTYSAPSMFDLFLGVKPEGDSGYSKESFNEKFEKFKSEFNREGMTRLQVGEAVLEWARSLKVNHA